MSTPDLAPKPHLQTQRVAMRRRGRPMLKRFEVALSPEYVMGLEWLARVQCGGMDDESMARWLRESAQRAIAEKFLEVTGKTLGQFKQLFDEAMAKLA